MFSIQILIAIAVTVGVAIAWTVAIMVAGAAWQRDQARALRALHPATSPSQDTTQTDDTRELVLR
jgi:hypothetical protein